MKGHFEKPAVKFANANQVDRIAKKIVKRQSRRQERREENKDFSFMTRPLRRKATPDLERVRRNLKPIIAYDLETTNIAKGTPKPLYLTACGDGGFWFSEEVLGFSHLQEFLVTRFLIPETSHARFVAWNGNKFDVYLIALALMKNPDYILRPYMTRGKNLRGMKVILKSDPKMSWEFLDGMAMLGILKKLSEFLKVFAPDYLKLEGAIDFEKETFSPRNPKHIKYAERDSEGLYHALRKAREIVLENFHIDLCPTVGNMSIKILQRFIPANVVCWKPPIKALRVIRAQVMRGGFCFCVQRYRGPVYKYDLNQAYAAAMRDAKLPDGKCFWSAQPNKYADVYIARIRATNFKNRIPFYYRDMEKGRSVFGLQDIGETWLTSIEINELKREGWKVEIFECWNWEGNFNLKTYVDKLEFLRVGEGRDPKDAQGEMIKYIGCNCYGKTVEQLEGLELLISAEQPEDFSPYLLEENALEYIWFKLGEPMLREYHQPQIGAFVTAHVRMVVRRAALLDPDSWLYADTDCVMFKQSQTVALDIDLKRYGAWKIEEEGTEFLIAAKKVYTSADGKTKHAKGMNVNRLSVGDFEKWLAGEAPVQTQVQRQSFIKVLSGFDMFIERTKVGEKDADKKEAATRAA